MPDPHHAWHTYARKGFIQARPYVPGEDLTNISVAPGCNPQFGDMVARSLDDHSDLWLIEHPYFHKHYYTEEDAL